MHDFSIGECDRSPVRDIFLPVPSVLGWHGRWTSPERARKCPASGRAHYKFPLRRNVDGNASIRGKSYHFRPLGQD